MLSPSVELLAGVPLGVRMSILAWEGSATAWLRCVGRPTVRFAHVAIARACVGGGEVPLLLLFITTVNPSGDVSGGDGLLLVALIRSDSILRRTLHSCVAFR